jgi:Zn finger protein HypA/HybF involved in hydrogenase expression
MDIHRILANRETNYQCPECGHTIRVKFGDFQREGFEVFCEACHTTSTIVHDGATRADLAELDGLVDKVEGKVNQVLNKLPFRNK